MKKLTIAALVAAQTLVAAQPVSAAHMVVQEQRQMGAFAGVRLRVPLDGARADRGVRAGLTLAPTLHSRRSDGGVRTGFGEGLELGIGPNRPVTLSLAGTRVDQLGMAPNGRGPEGARTGVSTLGWIAIGTGAVLVVGLGVGYLWLDDALDCDPGDDCS